ncbi:MAG: hypothetical protein MGU50_22695, partial [Trichodesmium sp. MAG_R02]|nr:hypothetical protein [Trichodesmium sp. MAG_R02]
TSVLETVTQPITKVEETVKLENSLQLLLFNEVAEGHRETIKWTGRKPQACWRGDSNDVSTSPESFLQLSLFD